MPRYDDWGTISADERGKIARGRLIDNLIKRYPGIGSYAYDEAATAALTELATTTADTVNIRAHGAPMNGVDDDYAWTQAIIDAVPAGRHLVMQDGSWKLSQALTLDKKLELTIDGASIVANDGLFVVTSDDVKIVGKNGLASMTQTWDASEDIMVDVQGAARFSLSGMRFSLTVTGATAEEYRKVVILVRDNVGHTVGSTDFAIRDNRITVATTQPGTSNRVHSIFGWTRIAAGAALVKGGSIDSNIIDGGGTRIIQLALADDVSIKGNVIRNVTAPVDVVAVSLIGVNNVSVSGANVVESNDTGAANVDAFAVRGDNPSRNVEIVGNSAEIASTTGRGVKIQAATSGGVQDITVACNGLRYTGAGSLPDGIIVDRAAAVTCQDIHIVGNHTVGWPRAQVEVSDSGGGDPSNVSIIGNKLNGTNPLLLTGIADPAASRIEYYANVPSTGTGLIVGINAASAGDVRLPNDSSIRARNNAADGDVYVARVTTADIVQVGGPGASEVQLSDGTDAVRMQATGHLRPASNGTQELGASSAQWKAVYANSIIAGDGYRQTVEGWYQDNVAANQTAVTLARNDGATLTGVWIAPRPGSVTAVSVKSNAARSAGTLTVEVYKGGVATGLTAVLDDDPTTFAATTQAKDTDAFVAGDELDIRITTDASWAPVTADIRACLEVET
jgi:hypothetical protein